MKPDLPPSCADFQQAESETRSGVGPSCLWLRSFGSVFVSDPAGAALCSRPQKAADLRTELRGQIRLGSAGVVLPLGAAEKLGRRPAESPQPPAGLQPALLLFFPKMDGFTGSLGESRPLPRRERPPGHLAGSGCTQRPRTPVAGLHVSLVYLSKRRCTAPPAAAGPQNQRLLLKVSSQRSTLMKTLEEDNNSY